MIDYTIPLDRLTAGMANCVREWILPNLTDPMARIQAEQLIGILQWLPRTVEAAHLRALKADSDEARALLLALGEPAGPPNDTFIIGDLTAENAALKVRLQALADRLRTSATAESAARLRQVQHFFVRSLRREGDGSSVLAFADMSIRDSEGKQDLS